MGSAEIPGPEERIVRPSLSLAGILTAYGRTEHLAAIPPFFTFHQNLHAILDDAGFPTGSPFGRFVALTDASAVLTKYTAGAMRRGSGGENERLGLRKLQSDIFGARNALGLEIFGDAETAKEYAARVEKLLTRPPMGNSAKDQVNKRKAAYMKLGGDVWDNFPNAWPDV
jgi:hypothetical protein